jgi:hypothetical protein
VMEELGGKNLDLGIYRHGPSTEPGCYVTAISIRPVSLGMVEDLIEGEPVELRPDEQRAFVLRRIDVIRQQEGEGWLKIRRGTRGARLDPDGSMDEQIGRG